MLLPACLLLLGAVQAEAQRLPRTVLPEHYELSLAPDLATERFTGRVRIDARVMEPTDRIVLNALDLEIARADVKIGSGNSRPVRVTVDEQAQQIALVLPAKADPGPVTMTLDFSGRLNGELRGLYVSSTPRRKYVATQFETTDARRAFPCFDEPAFKATFDMSVTIDEGDMAVSNGAQVSDVRGPAQRKHTVRFARTPKMSSYLVALAVGDFKCLEGRADATPIRVCATPDKVDLGRFALAAAERIVPWFNRYYGIPYPFKKLDVVGLPDFAAGAMENTAAIFYRESFLLADERSAPLATLKLIASVMSHEIAHQWFGDLVTLDWWDDVWLNEGFASWAANKPLEGWRGWTFGAEDFEDMQKAMSADALASSRAIRTRVNTPAEIEQAFDAITYEKAAAVLRMVEHYLGADAFQRGVHAYLSEFSYGNASAEDFWSTLAKTSGKPADRIMASFVEKPGLPIVDLRTSCQGNQTEVSLAQRRFVIGPDDGKDAAATPWVVPVCMVDGQGTSHCELLGEPAQKAVLPGCRHWVLGNDEAIGYYRVGYTPEALRAAADDRFGTLSEIERSSMAGDVWAATRAGDASIDGFLRVVEALMARPNRAVVDTVAPALRFVAEYLIADDRSPAWNEWVQQTFRPLLQELGWTPAADEPADRRAMRATVIEILGRGGDAEVIDRAVSLVRKDLAGEPVDPSLAAPIYAIAPLGGGESLYEQIRASLSAKLPPPEFYRRQRALAAFPEPGLIDRTLAYALSDEVRSQDAPLLLASILVNPAGREHAWQYIQAHWTEVEQRSAISRGVAAIVSALRFCDADAAQEVDRFFDAHPVPDATRNVTLTLEGIGACAATREAQAPRLTQFLSQ